MSILLTAATIWYVVVVSFVIGMVAGWQLRRLSNPVFDRWCDACNRWHPRDVQCRVAARDRERVEAFLRGV